MQQEFLKEIQCIINFIFHCYFQLLKHDPMQRLPLRDILVHTWVKSNVTVPPTPGSLAARGLAGS